MLRHAAPPLPVRGPGLQLAAQVQVPKWLATLLRIPGVGIIIALILLPLTLVRAGAGRPQRACQSCKHDCPATLFTAARARFC